MLSLALGQILPGNGYSTNLGQRVYFGDPPEAAERGKNAIYYRPMKKQIIAENKRWTHRQDWEISALYYTKNFADIKAVESDIWRALGSDTTLQGQVDNLMPAENDTVTYEYESDCVLVTLQAVTLQRTPTFTA